jgi:hypothetical protein
MAETRTIRVGGDTYTVVLRYEPETGGWSGHAYDQDGEVAADVASTGDTLDDLIEYIRQVLDGRGCVSP